MARFLGVALAVPQVACTPGRPHEELYPSDVLLLSAVAEVIIPTTLTPGAKAAGVGEFARMMVSDWFVADERHRFVTGLREFEEAARKRFGAAYDKLSSRQQTELVEILLGAAETAMGLSPPRSTGDAQPSSHVTVGPPATPVGQPPFIVMMKRLTILGYYTSEIGSSRELELNLVPGSYEACGHWRPDMRTGSLSFRNPTLSVS